MTRVRRFERDVVGSRLETAAAAILFALDLGLLLVIAGTFPRSVAPFPHV